MNSVAVIGAKGGVGTSCVAVRLSLWLSRIGSCVLLDGTPLAGSDDLLLDRHDGPTWVDLLPVLHEIDQKHLELAARDHESGVRLLAAPTDAGPLQSLIPLIPALEGLVDFLIVDGAAGLCPPNRRLADVVDHMLLVSTLDPPALRSCDRLANALAGSRSSLWMVLNQWNKQHPADPVVIADSVGLPLLGVLPLDHRSVFATVNFGQHRVEEGADNFGKAVGELGASMLAGGGSPAVVKREAIGNA
jgi:Flp pilus assembly CpaE family ATPase